MTQNKVNRKFNLLKFSALYGVAIILLGILFAAFTGDDAPASVKPGKSISQPSTVTTTIAEIDRSLHAQFKALAEADKGEANGNGIQSQEYALELENYLQIRLDSIENAVSDMPGASDAGLKDLLYHFRQILADRIEKRTTTITAIAPQPAVTDAKLQVQMAQLKQELVRKQEQIQVLGSRTGSANSEQVRKLQQEVEARNRRIAQLERQVANPENENLANAPAKGDNLRDLQQRNANLKLAYSSTQTQLGLVAKELNILKRENQRLQSLLADQR